jgi:TetR/AcrR family hemagglutinin/protease transcriptional regulator
LNREERRAQLQKSGVHVAARLGLSRVVHAELAREAGVSLATVFKYFPTREELLTAIAREVGHFYETIAEAAHKPDVDPADRLMRHARSYIDSIETHPDYVVVWLEWSASIRNEVGLWDLYVEHHARVMGHIRATISQVLPRERQAESDDLARITHALAYPIAHLKLTGASDELVVAFVRRYMASEQLGPLSSGTNLLSR